MTDQSADLVRVPTDALALVLFRYDNGITTNDQRSIDALDQVYVAMNVLPFGSHWKCRTCREIYGSATMAVTCCTGPNDWDDDGN